MSSAATLWRCLISSGLLVAQASAGGGLSIPHVIEGPKRLIAIEDMAGLRAIDTLSVSADGRFFAIFVHQGDVRKNAFRSGWFVGSIDGGDLVNVGTGGDLMPDDKENGVSGSGSRWSPDGRWIAYKLRRNGEVQLWRSRADGGVQEQLTHNESDVRDFEWSRSGEELYFTVGASRAALRKQAEQILRRGLRYDQDLELVTDFMKVRFPDIDESVPVTWTVSVRPRAERPSDAAERAEFESAQKSPEKLLRERFGDRHSARMLAVSGARSLAWLEPVSPSSVLSRVVEGRLTESEPIVCNAVSCSGHITGLWWDQAGRRVLFWRKDAINETRQSLFAWSASTGNVEERFHSETDSFQACKRASGDRLLCLRETPVMPVHVVSLDTRTGHLTVLADVNPEFRNIQLGKVERFEWDTPQFSWNKAGTELAGLYPERAYGFILYPPDFDLKKKYPVFIAPYSAVGFDNPTSTEHPLHVYAASGIIVLNTTFPVGDFAGRLGQSVMKTLYSYDLGFPHLSMLSESTLAALDAVEAQGFIDDRRVGIGGVSHGAFVPLYMMQKHDRITAMSISSSGWGSYEYYFTTRRGREVMKTAGGQTAAQDDWMPDPDGRGASFWKQIDLADHVDTIEAPILMNLIAAETLGAARLIRRLSDAGKAYDAYVFTDETHFKWQPAHLAVIRARNLDWFRFWLQEYEDPSIEKADQYTRWRELRELQCRNPLALRNYCRSELTTRRGTD